MQAQDVHSSKPLSKLDAATSMCNSGMATAATAVLLMELVEVATQMLRIDQMLGDIQSSAPVAADALQWQKVSVAALTMSRAPFEEKQKDLLQRLLSTTGCAAVDPALDPGSSAAEVRKPCPEESPTVSAVEPTKELAEEAEMEAHLTLHTDVPEDVSWDSSHGVRSLRKDLEMLKQYPDKRILIVRKIKALGFQSTRLLQEHFSQFGDVETVIVPHSATKPSKKRAQGRIRPGVLGFVVMGSTDAAEAAMHSGDRQSVCDASIEVAWFNDSHG